MDTLVNPKLSRTSLCIYIVVFKQSWPKPHTTKFLHSLPHAYNSTAKSFISLESRGVSKLSIEGCRVNIWGLVGTCGLCHMFFFIFLTWVGYVGRIWSKGHSLLTDARWRFKETQSFPDSIAHLHKEALGNSKENGIFCVLPPTAPWGDSNGGHRGKGPTEKIYWTKDIKQTLKTESDPCMPDSARGQAASESSAISEEQVRARLTSVLQYGFHPTTQKCCHLSAIQPSKMLRR